MKHKIYLCFLLTLPIFLYQAAFAAKLIESRHGDGSTDIVYIQDEKVRIDTSTDSSYVLIDSNNGTVLIVSPQDKQTIDMSNSMQPSKTESHTKHKLKFIDKGKGPVILGYQTRHYEVRVNNKKCAEEFTSVSLPKTLGIQKVFEKITSLPNETNVEMLPGMDVCIIADQQISEMYAEYGFPLRSLDAQGHLDTEVIRIEKNAPTPKGGFSPPANYQQVKMEDMMPDIQDMMNMSPEQLQNMPPEQQQQIQQMMDQLMQQMQSH